MDNSNLGLVHIVLHPVKVRLKKYNHRINLSPVALEKQHNTT